MHHAEVVEVVQQEAAAVAAADTHEDTLSPFLRLRRQPSSRRRNGRLVASSSQSPVPAVLHLRPRIAR